MTVSGSDKDTIAGHALHALVSVSGGGAGSTRTGGGLKQQLETQVAEQRTVKSNMLTGVTAEPETPTHQTCRPPPRSTESPHRVQREDRLMNSKEKPQREFVPGR